jgi:clan AA aspartic protease
VRSLTGQGDAFEGEFLVDTGAIDSLVPEDKLEAAQVLRERKKVYELANGEPAEYEIGFARVSFMGEETVVQVIFGPAGAEPILGVVALENVGIVVDPVSQRLKRLHASPLKKGE